MLTRTRALAVLLALAPLAAAGGSRRFELSADVGLAWPAFDGNYAFHSTPLLRGVTGSGSAEQTLRVDAQGATPALHIGLTFFPRERFGLRLAADWLRADLVGHNGPYDVELDYVAVLPPTTVPRRLHYERRLEWGDTSGHVAQFTGTLEGLLRLERGRTLSADLGAGLAYLDLRGQAQPLGYSEFMLLGHGVLSPIHYPLAYDVLPARRLGASLGAELHLALSERVWLHAAWRRIWARRTSHRLRLRLPDERLPDLLPPMATLEEINGALTLAPLELRPSSSRLALGLTCAF